MLSKGLSVLSYNVWGIFAARRVKERMELIADRLEPYDVICMQEQFDAADAPTLFKAGAHPYIHRFVTAIVGSGLTIASKYPILSNCFVPFRVGGRFERLWEGDAIANKGVAITRVLVPRSRLVERDVLFAASSSSAEPMSPLVDTGDGVEVLFFNTHLIAQYQKYSQIGGYDFERNAAHRLSQMHQMAQIVATTVTPGTPFFLCGDFNAGRKSPEMNLLHAYLASYGLEVTETAEVDSYSTSNVWLGGNAGTYLETMKMDEDIPVQLDHCLYGGNLRLLHGELAMTELLKSTRDSAPIHLSDHYGIHGSFVLADPSLTPVATVARLPRPNALRGEYLDALAFAEVFLERQAVDKMKMVLQLTAFSVTLLLICVLVLPYLMGDGGAGYVRAFVTFWFGFMAAVTLILAQVNRRGTAIAMEGAVIDIRGLRTTGNVCSGPLRKLPLPGQRKP
jgi:endonuclease/exonuclease/phosphatase family metal-dependent hydrolase